jgi:hypothetical protein
MAEEGMSLLCGKAETRAKDEGLQKQRQEKRG